MNKWLERIRGAVGMGLTWVAVWGFVGALLLLSLGVLTGSDPLAGSIVSIFGSCVLLGSIGGGALSVVPWLARRRTFDEMSLPHFAGLGALVSLLMFVAAQALWGLGGAPSTPDAWIMATVTALVGAGSAASSLALARLADDSEPLEDGESAGLIEGEITLDPDPHALRPEGATVPSSR